MAEMKTNTGKICIVKRRTREGDPAFGATEGSELCLLRKTQATSADPSSNESFEWRFVEPSAAEASPDDSVSQPHSVSIQLTPAQVDAIRAHPHFKLLAGAAAERSGMDVERARKGTIIFTFDLRRAYMAKLLTTQDVATTLRVSKGFVARLVKSGNLRSYKIGRLRRFSLVDVLSLISDSKEFL